MPLTVAEPVQRFVRPVVFLATIVLFAAKAASAADNPCAALIPPSGAYSLTKSDGSKYTLNSAKDFFCSSDFDQNASSNGWSFSLDVPGYGSVGTNGNATSESQRKSAFCHDQSQQFSQSETASLYRLQGDAVLVNGFVQCLNNQQRIYTASGTSVGDDVTITVQPNFPQNDTVERITQVAIVSGAEPANGAAIAPGTPLIGHSAVTGGYHMTAGAATFIVKTTTGDTQFVVHRCRNGMVSGPFVVKATTFTTQMQPIAGQLWKMAVPQAGCHPHCKLVGPPDPAGGDMIQTQFSAPSDVVLSNPRVAICSDVGCAFADNWAVTLLNAYTVNVQVRSRSLPFTATIVADAARPTQVGTESVLGSGTVTFGEPFSVLVPTTASNAYLSYLGANYPLDSLVDGAPFRIISPRSAAGNNYNYTLERDDACN